MRIDHLTVENFKGFDHREFHFHPQVNLLVGVNGTGKTTLLDAIAVSAGAWFLGMRGYDTRHIRPHEVRLQANVPKGSQTNGRRKTPITWEYQYPCAVSASGALMDQPMRWRRSLNTPGGRTTYVDARNVKNLAGQIDKAVRSGDQDRILPLVSYYGTGRLWNIPREQARVTNEKSLLGKAGKSRFAGYRNSIDPRVSVADLVRWIASQSWSSYQHGGAPSASYSAVRKAILSCLEGATDLYFDPARGEVIVEIERQGKQPFDNLSDGQRALFAMIGDIALKAATLNPQLEDRALEQTPGVVLIDELDLHLHPVWQRRVLENLRTIFPRIQFFASTHSPFLIQALRSGDELLMLEGSPTAQVANKTLQDIAEGIMGVSNPEVSERYIKMKNSATQFLEKLDEAEHAPRTKLAALQREMAKAVAPFADNPAFQAFLEMKQAAKLGK
jgi:predicted ATP-binding protein involved in virulence